MNLPVTDGLFAWYHGDDLNNPSVNGWSDRSGNGYDLQPNGSGNNLSVVTGGPCNRSGCRFSWDDFNGGQWLRLDHSLVATTYIMAFAIVDLDAEASDSFARLLSLFEVNQATLMTWRYFDSSFVNITGNESDSLSNQVDYYDEPATTSPNGYRFLDWGRVSTNKGFRYAIGGNERPPIAGSTTDASMGTTNHNRIDMGASFVGTVFELILYRTDTDMEFSDITLVRDYLSSNFLECQPTPSSAASPLRIPRINQEPTSAQFSSRIPGPNTYW